MSLKETYKQLKDLLNQITSDLDKGEAGNKAAAQRVRTGTVKLEKIAKSYRKESIQSEKKNKGQKKTAKTASTTASAPSPSKAGTKSSANNATAKKSTAASKAGSSKPSGSTASKTKSATVKAKAKAKATSFRPRQLAIKRATAKLPVRRVGAN